jgi:hypothetical protein
MPTTQQEDSDPFNSVLTLEDDLYMNAYALGATDGEKAGKIEGRIFGLEKGFEKFASLGALHGRSVVWGARLPSQKPDSGARVAESRGAKKVGNKAKGEGVIDVEINQNADIGGYTMEEENTQEAEKLRSVLPPLPPLPRLPPHITFLHSLTDLATFSTENSEDAVADLDDRFKRGQSKAKLVELLIKEPSTVDKLNVFEDAKGRPRKGVTVSGGEGVKNGDNMEDFGASRLLR